jgi:hypothetical protein
MPVTTWALPEEVLAEPERTPLLKKLFWVYFLLLFFEGALRKWVLPQFSNELLLIRDPIAIAILWEAYRSRKWPHQWVEIAGVLTLSLFALFLLQTIVLGFPWYIALFGLRCYLLPFPVAFVMGANLDVEDLRKFARCTLWLMLPLTALQVLQYYAPSDSFLNRGAGIGASQIAYTGGHVRASATFSFVAGPIHYMALAAGLLLYALVDREFIKPRILVWLSAAALLIAVPVTGSRSIVYELAGLLVMCLVAAFSGVTGIKGTLRALTVFVTIAAGVSQLSLFNESMQSLTRRFSEASNSEGDTQSVMKGRAVAPIAQSLESAATSSGWLGKGMGYGSNFAARTLTGDVGFLASESEWPRVIAEFGPFFGVAFMMFRVLLALFFVSKAIARVREHQPLAWLLIVATIPGLIFEILEQPTIQGFVVVTIAFTLAALNPDNFEPQSAREEELPLHLRRFGTGAR